MLNFPISARLSLVLKEYCLPLVRIVALRCNQVAQKFLFAALVIPVAALVSIYANAIEDEDSDEEDEELYEQYKAHTNFLARDEYSLRLQPLGLGLMGDTVDHYSGTLVITHTDVSLPGNSNLEVAIKRRMSTRATTLRQDFFMGDWELLIPNISMNLPLYGNLERTRLHNWSNKRCSNNSNVGWWSMVPIYTKSIQIPENLWWDGLKLNIPGFGSQTLLEHYESNDLEQNPVIINTHQQARWEPYKWQSYTNLKSKKKGSTDISRVTKNHWIVTCSDTPAINDKDRIDSNGPGEGFVAISPVDGTRYIFNRLTYQRIDDFRMVSEDGRKAGLDRVRAILFVTEVIDIHGNWVKYTYSDDGKLTKIHSNDDRKITITYKKDSNDVSSVTANGRTWRYEYKKQNLTHQHKRTKDNVLTKVILPDSQYWEFELGAMRGVKLQYKQCRSPYARTDSIKHPYGVISTYKLKETFLDSSYISNPKLKHINTCKDGSPSESKRALSLVEKTLKGKSTTKSVWKFEYQNATEYRRRKTTKTSPDGTKIEETYGGLSLNKPIYEVSSDGVPTVGEKRIFSKNNELIQTQRYSYYTSEIFGIDKNYEVEEGGFNHAVDSYVGKIETTRNKVTYTTEYKYNLDPTSDKYSYGHPVSVLEYNSTSKKKRNTTIEYEHNTNKWLIGLRKKISQNNKILRKYTYDGIANLLSSQEFNSAPWKYTYHKNGQVSSMQDPLGRTTKFFNFQAGIPQTVEFPDKTRITRKVDSNGWVISETDVNNTVFKYGYNNMGWTTLVDRPKGWQDTKIEYKKVSTNQILQIITRGNLQVEFEYDQLHRVTKETRFDKANKSATRLFRITSYDSLDRVAFQGYFSKSLNFTDGTIIKYNEFGQTVEKRDTLYPYATSKTVYLDNHVVKKIDALGNETLITYESFGYPRYIRPILVKQPEGITTKISYDSWGNVVTAVQNGVTQTWTYDENLKLCNYYSPEQNNTVYKYNYNDELIHVAYGQTKGKCKSNKSERTTFSYDSMGRTLKINYSDSTPDISYLYDKNGNLIEAKKGEITSNFDYNNLNQVILEEVKFGKKRTYATKYHYDSMSNLEKMTYTDGTEVKLYPDAFGRTTQIASPHKVLAKNIEYHSNGKVKSYQYDQDRRFYSRLNKRKLTRQLSYNDEMNLSYKYDRNGRVTQITDNNNTINLKKYSYDRLGRLTLAKGLWGRLSFDYDKSNNLIKRTFSDRSVEIEIGKSNRVKRIKDSGLGSGWLDYDYDKHGNVISNGVYEFVFNEAFQIVQQKGEKNDAFTYDGLFNRVKHDTGDGEVYWVYSQTGQLLYKDEENKDNLSSYIYLGRRLFAKNDKQGITYIYLNHLGSPEGGLDASFNNWTEHHTPFGEVHSSTRNESLGVGFTGQVFSDESKLIYMKNRVYDPKIGRFLNVDALNFKDRGLTQFNRYYYADNDPVNLKELSGDDPGFYDVIDSTQNGPISESDIEMKTDAAGAFINFANEFINPFADVFIAVNEPSWQNVGIVAIGALPGPNLGKYVKNLEPCGCFLEGTLVDTANGLVEIESIDVGDIVSSRRAGTAENELKAVTGTINGNIRQVWNVTFEVEKNVVEVFQTTEDHPWWNRNDGWVETKDLRAGMLINSKSGNEFNIVDVRKTKKFGISYNIKVKDNETYFVGKNGLFVHNGPCDSLFEGLSGRKSRQIGKRGWSKESIVDTINNPSATRNSINKSNGNSATAYYDSDGKYVVVDDETGQLVQIEDKTTDNWSPDDTIDDPL